MKTLQVVLRKLCHLGLWSAVHTKFSPSIGLVPGVFLTFIVWQVVPGLRLGDESSIATGFWKIIEDRKDRDLIRDLFQRTYNFGVGFREWIRAKPILWNEATLVAFDPVKVPKDKYPLGDEWDHDTSGWEF
ncbi:hypothetical protein N7520_002752 [Penicillium odoratum]|uniref:uncharacterized protein n=1 Tax=Penicillium odoratum TaxID=1167516 RepID=UPI0025475DC9|nr:uncharacterized protein N7520_002752 [Penicillium odoratum]KAJ5772223.1 hypothetical protein N7520_002752 [Penicillium odoratum]